jgi:hypothetical protein
LSVLLIILLTPGYRGHFFSSGTPSVNPLALENSINLEKELQAQLNRLKEQYKNAVAGCVIDEPITPEPPAGEFQIPADAAKNNDLSFLEGCWDSASQSLVNAETRLPIITRYCFDNAGNAVVTVEEKDKNGNVQDVCSTTATAKFVDDKLVMTDRGGALCSKSNTKYSDSEVICTTLSDGKVDCIIEQEEGSSIHTTFERVDS